MTRYRYTGPGGESFPSLTRFVGDGPDRTPGEPLPDEEFDGPDDLEHPRLEVVGDGAADHPPAGPAPATDPDPDPGIAALEAEEARIEAEIAAAKAADPVKEG